MQEMLILIKNTDHIMNIAITGRVTDASNARAISDLLERFAAAGAGIWCHDILKPALVSAGVPPVTYGPVFSESEGLPQDVDMLLVFGGDGTFLSTLGLVYGRDIPVAGINSGRLGFLTAARLGDEAGRIAGDLLAGRYSIQERAVLRVSADRLPDAFCPLALNEFVIRRNGARMLSVDVSVDGHALPPYWADGIMVVTPTGSTAYSLSLGGPVVAPDSRVMLITPLASHNLNVRPLVIPLESDVDIVFHTPDGSGILTADNRAVELPEGSKITVTCAGSSIKCVSFDDDSFIGALKDKLFWGEDKRNEII